MARRHHARYSRQPRRAGVRRPRARPARRRTGHRMGVSARRRAGRRCRSRRALRRALREHRARARQRGRTQRLPPQGGRATRRGLRLGGRAGDDRRGHRRHQHAERDAATGGDHRAHVRPRARRPADDQGPTDAHRPLARAHGPHGPGPDRPHARRGRRGPHRQGAAAHGADVRPAPARHRSERGRRDARLPPHREGRPAHAARRQPISSSSAACSMRARAT